MPDKLTMPSLREAMWSSSPNPNATLDDVLKAVAPTGSVAGIAYTTAGAHAITSISKGKLHSSDGDVEQALIYELRLWEVGILCLCFSFSVHSALHLNRYFSRT